MTPKLAWEAGRVCSGCCHCGPLVLTILWQYRLSSERNLADAVIATGLISSRAANFPGASLGLLTRPLFNEIFMQSTARSSRWGLRGTSLRGRPGGRKNIVGAQARALRRGSQRCGQHPARVDALSPA
jgi:hypothetical protein